MTQDEEVLNANQQAIAAAISSIGHANALAIVAIGAILDAKQVIPKEQFADMMAKLANFVDKMPNSSGSHAGAEMLRKVYEIINPPAAPTKWKPAVVPGGKQ